MTWHAAEALIRCSGRVEQFDGTTWRPRGTAFFVTKRTLLTCAHVARQAAQTRVCWVSPDGLTTLPVTVERFPDVADADPYPLPDVAVLRVPGDVEQLPTHGVARLDGAQPGDDLWATGFTDEYARRQMFGHPCRFRLVGPAQAEGPEPEGVWRIAGDRVRAGMSGAPLLDLQNGRVVGIVKRTQDESMGFGAWFTPLTTLVTVPEIATIINENQALYRDAREDHVLAKQLWGVAVDRPVRLLVDEPDLREQLATMLGIERLEGDDIAQARRVAREMFLTSIDVLVECANRLARGSGAADAVAIFEAAAACTTYGGDQWVSAGSAAELAAQVERLKKDKAEMGVVIQLDTDESRIAKLYLRRGDRDGVWGPPLELGPFSHETHEDLDIPADIELALRSRLLDRDHNLRSDLRAPVLTPQAQRDWDRERPKIAGALQRQRVVVVLPDRTPLDARLVEGLTSLAPLAFLAVTADPGTRELHASPAFQLLAPDVNEQSVGEALYDYNTGLTGLHEWLRQAS